LPSQKVGDLSATAMLEKILSDKQIEAFKDMTDKVPNEINSIINEVRDSLSNTIIISVRNLRWRRGLSVTHNFVRSGGGLAWSNDGEVWKTIPNEFHIDLLMDFPIKQVMSLDEIASIQELITKGQVEPLAHELFSEAWALRTEHPRSALVIAMAAAETGFKELVGRLLPPPHWLLENISTPPLIKMLEEFLPLLPEKCRINGNKIKPPKRILEQVKKGTTVRNGIVHGTDAKISAKSLEAILRAVRDLLYIYDLYSGLRWAVDNISGETLNDLQKSESTDSK